MTSIRFLDRLKPVSSLGSTRCHRLRGIASGIEGGAVVTHIGESEGASLLLRVDIGQIQGHTRGDTPAKSSREAIDCIW